MGPSLQMQLFTIMNILSELRERCMFSHQQIDTLTEELRNAFIDVDVFQQAVSFN